MSKRLSQLNQIEQATPENYMLLDAENFLESKKIKLKDIDIENFNTTKFYNREQADEKIISAIAECVEKVEGNSMTDQVYAVDSIGTPKTIEVEDVDLHEFGNSNFGYAIPRRKLNGNLVTHTPETELDCANKKYVDEIVGDIENLLGGI